MDPRPVKVAASRSRGLVIVDWEDGHHSEYTFSDMRAACPCAQCRGHPGSPGLLRIPLSSTASTELERVDSVGNYAIQLVWKDGHAYGIYTWEYLRELCPCGEHG